MDCIYLGPKIWTTPEPFPYSMQINFPFVEISKVFYKNLKSSKYFRLDLSQCDYSYTLIKMMSEKIENSRIEKISKEIPKIR